MDVTKVGLEASSGRVGQRDEGGAGVLTVGRDITADRGVGAGIAVLILEPAEELGGGVPLLGRGVAIVAEGTWSMILVNGPSTGAGGGLVRV